MNQKTKNATRHSGLVASQENFSIKTSLSHFTNFYQETGYCNDCGLVFVECSKNYRQSIRYCKCCLKPLE